MALAKAVVTGSVFRAPEKRFTQNNVPVSSFVLNIGEREEMLIRVIVRRTALDEVVSSISKDDMKNVSINFDDFEKAFLNAENKTQKNTRRQIGY